MDLSNDSKPDVELPAGKPWHRPELSVASIDEHTQFTAFTYPLDATGNLSS